MSALLLILRRYVSPAVGIPVCLVRMVSSIPLAMVSTASLVMASHVWANPRRVHALGHARILGSHAATFALLLSMMAGMNTWGAGGHGELGWTLTSIEPRRLDSLRRRSRLCACGASHNVLPLAAGEESGGGSSDDEARGERDDGG